jgi:hypothetical protein
MMLEDDATFLRESKKVTVACACWELPHKAMHSHTSYRSAVLYPQIH